MLAKRFHAIVDPKRCPRQRRSTARDGHQSCVATVSVSPAQEKWPPPPRQTAPSRPALRPPVCRRPPPTPRRGARPSAPRTCAGRADRVARQLAYGGGKLTWLLGCLVHCFAAR